MVSKVKADDSIRPMRTILVREFGGPDVMRVEEVPDPKPGLIVRYDYLWSHEAAAGRDQGKDRPTCLVAASDSVTKPRFVVLLPITHSPPDVHTIGIEIPAKVRQA